MRYIRSSSRHRTCRPVAGFELDVDALVALSAGRPSTHSDVTTFPAVLQDIAVVVADDVAAAEVEEAVRAGGGELLAGVRVFDLPRRAGGGGTQVARPAARVQAPDRTLTDSEVAERRTAIERELEAVGGRLRA